MQPTQNTPPKKVAVLYFGLARSLKSVIPSLERGIYSVLRANNIEYDNFVHTFSLPNPYIDPMNKSVIKDYDNDSYKLLNPRDFIIEDQNEVSRTLKVREYFSHVGTWGGYAKGTVDYCRLVRNMTLALYSKKRVAELFSKYMHEYDYVIVTRPDQAIENRLNPICFSMLNNNNIIIPKEHSYLGINDRMCVATPSNAIRYCNAFRHFLRYSRMKTIISEVYWKWYILKVCKLNIIYGNVKASLIRM